MYKLSYFGFVVRTVLFIEFPGRNLVGYLALNKLLYGHWAKKNQDAYSVMIGN